MDIQEVNLRRSDFEAMHPIAKLFNFDHEKLTYFGDAYDDAKRLNDLWSTWCACVSLLYLETNTTKAQAVPEGFVLVSKEIPDSVVDRLRYSSYHWGDGTRDYFTPVYQMIIEAQEPNND